MKIIRKLQRTLLYIAGGYTPVDLDLLGTFDQWNIYTKFLQPGSIIISGGVGHNISFERELVERFGCTVHLFDPSPTAIDTMKRSDNQHRNLKYYPVGLAGEDGLNPFGEPDDPREGSFKKTSSSSMLTLKCKSVESVAFENKWTKVDLLKIDIEGFEYEVIQTTLSSDIFIAQICVEFHTSEMIGINETVWDIVRMVLVLRRRGYRLVSIRRSDFTFIHNSVLRSTKAPLRAYK